MNQHNKNIIPCVEEYGPGDGRTGKRVREKESIEMLTLVKTTAL